MLKVVFTKVGFGDGKVINSQGFCHKGGIQMLMEVGTKKRKSLIISCVVFRKAAVTDD